MQAIKDYASYNNGMAKSLEDKLFFEDWLNDGIEHLVDFGCADGTLLAEIHKRYPGLKLTGIDSNELMLKKVSVDCDKVCSNMPVPKLDTFAGKTALNLSSVLHEVYSYGSKDYIRAFWHSINDAKRYGYVFIRDMMYSPLSQATESDLYQKNGWTRNVYKFADPDQVKDFEYYQGNLSNMNKKNLVHFLLKYRYVQNWEREVRENYFAMERDEVMKRLSNYNCVFYQQYTLPFLHDRLKEDFDIDFNEMTHVKMVFKLKS